MHCRVTLAALEAGKHVLTEARMAMNAGEAHIMRDAARAKPHLIVQVVPSPSTLRIDATVKRLLAEGYLGDLLAIDVRGVNSAFLDRNAPLRWRDDADVSGVNSMNIGIWYEAIMRWAGEAAKVMAMGKTFVTMRKDGDGLLQAVRIPEHLDVIAEMACGAQAHFQCSQVSGFGGPPTAMLYGSEGTLRFSQNTLYGGQRNDAELKEIVIPPEQEGRWRVEEEFINAIRGQEVVALTTFDDGVKYMEFTEAVARSITTGKAVSLPLL